MVEIDYNFSVGNPHKIPTLIITSFKRRNRRGYNGIFCREAKKIIMSQLGLPERVRVLYDDSRGLLTILPSLEGFKLCYTSQGQIMVALTSFIKEMGQEILGSFPGRLENSTLVFNLRNPID